MRLLPPACDRGRITARAVAAAAAAALDNMDPAVSAAAAAALCAVLARRLPAPTLARQPAEPVLTPLLFIADRRLRPDARTGDGADTSLISSLFHTVRGTALIALLAVIAQPGWTFRQLALSALPVAALFLVYAALIPRTTTGLRFVPSVLDLDEAIGPLSNRVMAILATVLAVQIIGFGVPRTSFVLLAMLLGLAKAFTWHFTIQTAQQTSWILAPAIGTFGILASSDPFIQLSELDAVSPVIASLLALTQIVYMLPRSAKGRPTLWALALISLGPYVAYTIAMRNARSMALHSLEHPIEVLIRNAQADFSQMLERQSKTYEDAVNEYQRRYEVEPPPGFEAWYEFAVANQSPIIDEFDTIYKSVSPFWKLSGKEVVQIMNDAQDTADIDLWLCSFSGKTAETHCIHPRRNADRHVSDLMNRLLGDLRGVLPDVKFLVNHLDEPRVLIPRLTHPNPSAKQWFTVTDLSERPTWNAITKYCPSHVQQGEKGKTSSQTEPKTEDLPLITNLSAALDLCQHPEYANMHGLFQGPPSFRLIEGRVPVLSTGAPSTMSDILIPSPAYVLEDEFLYNATFDVPWPQKANHLYWTGSTTGAPCREQASHFRALSWQPRDAALGARLVFDLDGNGISGRFHKLLASRSLVLKQTLLREWHDDRLAPWLHYVPVSVGMAELPEVVRWLVETERGRAAASELGRAGAEWAARAVREVDVKLYVWRLVLELARLVDEGRGALAVVGESD
ncbi:a9b004c4-81da-411f-a4bf-bc72ac1d63e1 [Thermothielavioides terrestris]|uniref:A9b004c4-81da-411f-a4bf-bc72ac1d63e1 n=1 Tax=Thermothielavioides terrestris TaxID=2587410 RepID=A0A3S4F4W3_9PEZI|nr:a9b004c4-81da-411f-a4bf-bc72ac1d63e1 [Thermothielavioides terrestris]